MIMTGGIMIERSVANAPALAARKRFRGYKRETEKASRKAEVQESEALRQIKDVWRVLGESDMDDMDDWYEKLLPIVRELQYASMDIELFSFSIEESQFKYEDFSEKAGLFLSALINNGEDAEYLIHTDHLAEPLEYIGFWNEKSITVDGDAGSWVGMYMKEGRITVEGDAGSDVGNTMKGGSITINGNTGDKVGAYMEGGGITVEGDTGHELGFEMKDGSILVKGNATERVGADMCGGRITVNGDAGNHIGWIMYNGEIHLEGDYGSTADLSNSRRIYYKGGFFIKFFNGRIYHKGKLISGE
jgi:hypothetical protein